MGLNSTTAYLVSCVSKKRTESYPARDLYVSNWFLKARCYAESSGCRWFILSAKHGLIAPDQVIAPYNQTLKKMAVAERQAWSKRVASQLCAAVPDLAHIVLLAGQRYREFLVRYLIDCGIEVDVPMKGLRIGEQLRWLKQHAPH